MSFGFQVLDANGNVTFQLSTRLTTLLLSRVVGRNDSGSVQLDIPGTMNFTAQAIPLDGDQHMRHLPHRLTYVASTRTLRWEPSVGSEDTANLAAWARPLRSRSRILVFGYMPEV